MGVNWFVGWSWWKVGLPLVVACSAGLPPGVAAAPASDGHGVLLAAHSSGPNPPAAASIAAQKAGERGKPVFAIRELYAPGHFGNSYEVMGEYEMRRLLAEAVFWGFNRYGDWFDMEDCSDPFKPGDSLGHAMWHAKKTNFRSAQTMGLACDLIITPNHVYVDQCLPELRAVQGGRPVGQYQGDKPGQEPAGTYRGLHGQRALPDTDR